MSTDTVVSSLLHSAVSVLHLCGGFESLFCFSLGWFVWPFPTEIWNITWDRAPGPVGSTLQTHKLWIFGNTEETKFDIEIKKTPQWIIFIFLKDVNCTRSTILVFGFQFVQYLTVLEVEIRPGVSSAFDGFCFPWMRLFLCRRLFQKTQTKCCWCFIHELDRSDLSSSLTRPLCLCLQCFCPELCVSGTLCCSACFCFHYY